MFALDLQYKTFIVLYIYMKDSVFPLLSLSITGWGTQYIRIKGYLLSVAVIAAMVDKNMRLSVQ